MTGLVQPYAGHPYTGMCRWLHLEPGDVLCRVWDRDEGKRVGFDALDWNPNRKDLLDSSAGRFDPVPPVVPQAGFLYGSKSDHANEKVALLETFRSLMFRDPRHSGRNVIPRAERNCRSIRRFELMAPVSLVDLNGQLGRECFRMDEEVLYVHDRQATRTWSDAVKAAVSTAGGIAYNSTRESIGTGCHSFVLWEDRATTPRFKMVDEVDLSTPAGRDLVDEALADYDIQWG